MRESDLIRAMWRYFPRNAAQKNSLFGTDAEIVTIGGELWAITTDEFSNEEDGFGAIDSAMLGHNLVAAVLSDLVAVGATPRFFLHTIALPPGTKNLETLSTGIAETLHQADVFLLGGDLGQAPSWRYTGVALGSIEPGHPITRQVAHTIEKHDLWVTGMLGNVNLAALVGDTVPRLNLHSHETRRFIAEHATACIDTSGGLIDAIWTMSEQSPGMRFEVDAGSIPAAPQVVEYCRANRLPPLAFLLGGAGEYELLFTTPVGMVPEIDATRIGRVLMSDESGLFMKRPDGRFHQIVEPPPCPREYKNRADYILAILEQVKRITGT